MVRRIVLQCVTNVVHRMVCVYGENVVPEKTSDRFDRAMIDLMNEKWRKADAEGKQAKAPRNECQLNERNYDGQIFFGSGFCRVNVDRRDFPFPILSRGKMRLSDTVWDLDSWKGLD